MTEERYWTPGRIDDLKRLAAEGQSTSSIAMHLGGVTRNAVIGKLHRLGIRKDPRTRSKPEPKPKPKKVAKPAPPKLAPIALAPAPLPPPEPPPTGSVDLMGLRSGMCRYPYGETAPYLFCGEPTNGRSFCRAHEALCYTPPGRTLKPETVEKIRTNAIRRTQRQTRAATA